jgi:hypothetical protein
MTHPRIRTACAAILIAAALASALPAAAQSGSDGERKKFGFFIGAHLTRFALAGDFDGITLIVPDETEAFIMPKVTAKQATGFSIGAGTGRGGSDRFFVEIRHYESTPSAVYQGEAVAAKASVWTAGVRYMYTDTFIQPYIRGGFSYGRLRITDGAIDVEGNFGDAIFLGGGLEVALGAAIWLPPCFSIFAEGSYDGMDFRNVKGPQGVSWNTMGLAGTGLGGGGLNFAVGLQIMY